jgi:hypothetical protein
MQAFLCHGLLPRCTLAPGRKDYTSRYLHSAQGCPASAAWLLQGSRSALPCPGRGRAGLACQGWLGCGTVEFMLTIDEARFYRQLRGPTIRMGGRISRLENAVESGWPDVLIRFYPDIHVWVELKIAKGSKAKIKVRPEQINWAEDHRGQGGRVYLIAQDSKDPSWFWVVPPEDVRRCSKQGCLDQPRVELRNWQTLLRSWMRPHDIQRTDSAHPQERSRLERATQTDTGPGAVLQIVRRARLPDTGNDGGSHHSALERRRSRGLEPSAVVRTVPRRENGARETRRTG